MCWKAVMSTDMTKCAATGCVSGAMIDPHVRAGRVRPQPWRGRGCGSNITVVRDLNGNLVADRMVGHVFRIENGLIKRFDIRGA